MKYHTKIALGFDQFANTILGGWPDETLSSRAWRKRETKVFWRIMRFIIDRIFFWQKNHCQNAYFLELKRHQGPHEFRD